MKNIKKYLILFCAAVIMLMLTACGSTEVDVAPYLSISYRGRNGTATAAAQFDFAEFEHEIMSQWKKDDKSFSKLSELTALESTFQLEASKTDGLRNGDTVTVKLKYNEEKAKELGYSFKNTEKTFTVEGLEEAIEIDPFDETVFGPDKEVDVRIDGTSPYISVYISNRSWGPHSNIRYKLDKDFNLTNGDTVTVTASIAPNKADEYALTRTETTLSIEGFQSYVTDISMLSHEGVQTLQTQMKEYMDKRIRYGLDLHTSDSQKLSLCVDGDGKGTHSDIAFTGSGYVVGTGEDARRSNWLLVPFRMTFENNSYFLNPGETPIPFPDAYGYFIAENMRIDTEGNLIPNYGSISSIELFENQELMNQNIMDTYGKPNPEKFN